MKKPFYPLLESFITSGPVVAIVAEGPEAGLVLGANLARRDIERMGGSLIVEGGFESDGSWTAFIPNRTAHEDLP